MKQGQVVILASVGEDPLDAETEATVVAVMSDGDVPGPKLLDLQIGEGGAVIEGVRHVSVVPAGTRCWQTKQEQAAARATVE